MIILVLGTPDSGKSEKAEELVMELEPSEEKIYIATMVPFGDEGKRRVAKHREMREGKGFITLEKPTGVDDIADEVEDIADKCCLLECMSNLVGNEMHEPSNVTLSDEELVAFITNQVIELGKACGNLVVVSNRFPADEPDYDEDTKRYVMIANAVNEKLKEKVDKVYEIC